jgi:photosynthetic reaction center cytochrome c subunit
VKVAGWVLGAVFVFLAVFMLTTAGWERPPVEDEQEGFRGTGMVQVDNPRTRAANAAVHEAPEASELPPSAGPTAEDVYDNIEVLNDVPAARFSRLMQAMTEWVAPEEGCTYCHAGDNMASDAVYTKNVTRHMLQMTRSINSDWDSHVKGTGVTCYTCHRGNNVPQETWVPDQPRKQFRGMAGNRAGQNAPDTDVGLSSLPGDPFSKFLDQAHSIRVASGTALPSGNPTSIQATEHTYGLMMHMSTSLGVNCAYCHNSRAFRNWEQSNPPRETAWHGIRMVRAVNNEYVSPLADMLPAKRKGPEGHAKQANCATCHQGISKPLYGASMVDDYPSLTGSGAKAASRSRDGETGPSGNGTGLVASE